eukprot:683412-Pelagomonas_calceolata.AAC.2
MLNAEEVSTFWRAPARLFAAFFLRAEGAIPSSPARSSHVIHDCNERAPESTPSIEHNTFRMCMRHWWCSCKQLGPATCNWEVQPSSGSPTIRLTPSNSHTVRLPNIRPTQHQAHP